ncbi:hypothetical protein BZM27_53540, partial [Paraburkholderia steynii]
MRRPDSDIALGVVGVAPALNVQLFARGLSRHVLTRLYFPDQEEANQVDPILARVEKSRRKTLIARAGKGPN